MPPTSREIREFRKMINRSVHQELSGSSSEKIIESFTLKDFARIRHFPRFLIVHDEPKAPGCCIEQNRNCFTGNMIQSEEREKRKN